LKANFACNPRSIEVAGISVDKYETEYVHIELSRLLNENEVFELEIGKIEDCSGNVMDPATLRIGNFLPPDSSEILISEVLFNPRAGGVDFVEIYNNSTKNINLKGWFFAGRGQKEELSGLSAMKNKDLIMGPGEYLAFTENKDVLLSQYPDALASAIVEIPTLPSLPVVAGSVILMDGRHKIYDEFSYFEDMHHPMLDDRKGVSLERISFDVTTSSIENWKSSSFSGHFSTPGYRNSQTDTNLSQANIFYAEPLIFFPRSKGEPDKTYLKFSLSETGSMITVNVLDSGGRVVKNLLKNGLSGSNGAVSWDGTDNSGYILPTGYYLFHVEISSLSAFGTYLIKMVSGAY
jgi:hypothetical protein